MDANKDASIVLSYAKDIARERISSCPEEWQGATEDEIAKYVTNIAEALLPFIYRPSYEALFVDQFGKELLSKVTESQFKMLLFKHNADLSKVAEEIRGK